MNTWFRCVPPALLSAALQSAALHPPHPSRLLPSARPGPPLLIALLVPVLLLTGCAFSTIGVGYDPYVTVWVDDHPAIGDGQGATLSLESREDGSSPRARVSVSRHEMPGGGGTALYWRLMGVTEIDTDSLLIAVGGPAAPYVSVGFGFEFIQYPKGVGEDWTGNPSVSAAVGLRAREESRLRWYVEGRGGLWVWLPGFPAWPFSSAWGAGAAISAGADFRF